MKFSIALTDALYKWHYALLFFPPEQFISLSGHYLLRNTEEPSCAAEFLNIWCILVSCATVSILGLSFILTGFLFHTCGLVSG